MLATCQPRISRPNVRSRHTFKKQIIASSYIAASNDLVPERWGLLSLDPLAGWISPFGSILSLGIRARPEYPRSVSDPLGWTILSPSEENATAKRGYERRSPIAYNLPLGACTPIHAFETCPSRTQPTSLKRGCSIIPQHRVSCQWSTPQSDYQDHLRSCPVGGLRHKGDYQDHLSHCVGSIAASRTVAKDAPLRRTVQRTGTIVATQTGASRPSCYESASTLAMSSLKTTFSTAMGSTSRHA